MASKCCRICGCSTCLITAFVILIILWIAYARDYVDMKLKGVEVGAFNLSNTGLDWDLNITFTARNGNKHVEVGYIYVSTILWYRNQKLDVQAFSGPEFRQGQKSTLERTLRLQPRRQVQLLQDRGSAMAADLQRGVVPLRLKLVSRYQFHRPGWTSWKQRSHQFCYFLTISPSSAPWGGRLLACSCYSEETRKQLESAD